jgi:hypothetical protein
MLAEVIHEQRPGLDLVVVRRAVDGDRYVRQRTLRLVTNDDRG